MLPGLEVCRWEGDGEGRAGGQLGEKVGELGGGYREEIEMSQEITISHLLASSSRSPPAGRSVAPEGEAQARTSPPLCLCTPPRQTR